MPFYTGSANSFADLHAALFSACVAEGWTLEDANTLSKGAAVVRATVNTVSTNTFGVGIILQGATGLSGGSLVNASANTPRFGPPHTVRSQASWPMTYFIHIFDDPDEVFMVVNFNVDFYWWLAFGVSDNTAIPGTGLWMSAISRGGQGDDGASSGIVISSTGGGNNLNGSHSSGAIFWHTSQSSSARSCNDTIQSGLDGVLWAGNPTSSSNAAPASFNAILSASTQIARLPSAWNGEAVFVPIQGYVWRAGNKCSPVVDVRKARYTRVDNYTPGEIISLGEDQWKIYPFYRKDTAARDGGNVVDHTGTFGWAIRYDGP